MNPRTKIINGLTWELIHPRAKFDMLGYIPTFIHLNDPRPAKEQFDNNYQHGGGWRAFQGFKFNERNLTLNYPGDPPTEAIAETYLKRGTPGEERVIVYNHAWVQVIQKDGTWEVARMD